jgi:hypothetical protein
MAPKSFGLEMGICGKVARTGISLDINNHHTYPDLNLLVDIETHMPSFTNIIKIENKNYAVLQFASLQPNIGGNNSR